MTLLIHSTGREEDAQVEELLSEALELRQSLEPPMPAMVAETLNSMGTLRQKQRRYDEALQYYEYSLAARQSVEAMEEDAKQAKLKAIAQSLVSLGNLAIERGDEAARAGGGVDTADGFYALACEHMSAAKQAYIEGAGEAGENHPKVAWAMEGLGRVFEKRGNLDGALREYKGAARIRSRMQAHGKSKELFTRELAQIECKIGTVSAEIDARQRQAGAHAPSPQATETEVHVSLQGSHASTGEGSPEGPSGASPTQSPIAHSLSSPAASLSLQGAAHGPIRAEAELEPPRPTPNMGEGPHAGGSPAPSPRWGRQWKKALQCSGTQRASTSRWLELVQRTSSATSKELQSALATAADSFLEDASLTSTGLA